MSVHLCTSPPELNDIQGKYTEQDIVDGQMYEIGLALYEYIALPNNDESWSDDLTFDHPAFKTPEGEQLKTLIMEMTAPAYQLRDVKELDSYLEEFAREGFNGAKTPTFCLVDKNKQEYIYYDKEGGKKVDLSG